VRAARDFARGTLQRWGITGRCDDITVVVSELVTNALRYGLPPASGWPIRVGLLQPAPGSGVLCAVADSNPAAPALAPLDDQAESGRGLQVVQSLSDTWGCTVISQGGKVVWAAFAAVGHTARS
jgi:two-component sensor histidine kinase